MQATLQITPRQLDDINFLESIREEMLADIAEELNTMDRRVIRKRNSRAKCSTLEERQHVNKELCRLELKRSIMRNTLFGKEDLVNQNIDRKIEIVRGE